MRSCMIRVWLPTSPGADNAIATVSVAVTVDEDVWMDDEAHAFHHSKTGSLGLDGNAV